MPQPYNIFTIYAREDTKLLSELLSQLKPLEISGRIKVWSDREINPGVQWEQEIVSHLDTADIILILVSPAYYNSEYIHRVEIKRAVERHERGEAKVLPIIVRPCSFEDDPVVSSLQLLPTDGKAVTDDEHWRSQDKAWLDVVNGVKRTLNALRDAENSQKQIAEPQKEKEERKRKPDVPSILTREQHLRVNSGKKTISQVENAKTRDESKGGQLSINFDGDRVSKLFGIFFLFLSLYLFIAFVSYLFTWENDHDITFRFSWDMLLADQPVENWLGRPGAFLSDSIIYWGFGVPSFGIVYLLYKYGHALVRRAPLSYLGIIFQRTIILMIITSIVASFFFQKFAFPVGGVVGQFIANNLQDTLGAVATIILLVIAILLSIPHFRSYLMRQVEKFL